MGALKLTRVKKISLTNQVVDTLKTSIIKGDLPPGAHLGEHSLAAQLGVSRGSLREAFVQLEAEGLVISHPGRGSFVTELSTSDVTEIYALRVVLEKEAVRLFAQKVNKEQVAVLNELSEKMIAAEARKDSETIVRLNLRYHNFIWEAAGNQRLYDLLSMLYRQVQLYLASAMQLQTQDKRLRTLQEHKDLAAAVSVSDTDAAVAIMQVHLEEAERLVKMFLAKLLR